MPKSKWQNKPKKASPRKSQKHDKKKDDSKLTFWNNEWLDYQEWKLWLRPHRESTLMAHCILCNSSFSLSNMGVGSIKSHAKGSTHSRLLAERATLRQPFERSAAIPAAAENQAEEGGQAVEAAPAQRPGNKLSIYYLKLISYRFPIVIQLETVLRWFLLPESFVLL